MYDNTDMNLKKEVIPGINFLETIPKYLTKITNDGNTDYGYYNDPERELDYIFQMEFL